MAHHRKLTQQGVEQATSDNHGTHDEYKNRVQRCWVMSESMKLSELIRALTDEPCRGLWGTLAEQVEHETTRSNLSVLDGFDQDLRKKISALHRHLDPMDAQELLAGWRDERLKICKSVLRLVGDLERSEEVNRRWKTRMKERAAQPWWEMVHEHGYTRLRSMGRLSRSEPRPTTVRKLAESLRSRWVILALVVFECELVGQRVALIAGGAASGYTSEVAAQIAIGPASPSVLSIPFPHFTVTPSGRCVLRVPFHPRASGKPSTRPPTDIVVDDVLVPRA